LALSDPKKNCNTHTAILISGIGLVNILDFTEPLIPGQCELLCKGFLSPVIPAVTEPPTDGGFVTNSFVNLVEKFN
jgi:hypothetical protein